MHYVLLSYFLTLDAILCIYWRRWNNILLKDILKVFNFNHKRTILSRWGIFFSNKLQYNYQRYVFMAWLSSLDLVHSLSKWLLTPFYVDSSLQSQRKLASSTLTLILFQQSAQNTRSTIFVVTVGMTTVALVDMGIIVSVVHVICMFYSHSHMNT